MLKTLKEMEEMRGEGFFICVEGLDGCGKTTQTKLLVKRLKKMGYDTLYTAEPSHGRIGTFIKKHYLHGEKRFSAVIEALLFAADRFEHVEKEVIPALDGAKIVISDRYIYSSLAYQGATGIDLKWIETVNEHAIKPDLAIFVDVEPEAVVRRLKPKKSVMENLDTQHRVRKVYMNFVQKGELVKIDGSKSKREVADDILKLVLKRVGSSAKKA